MNRLMSVVAGIAVVVLLAGAALAMGPGGRLGAGQGMGMGQGVMGMHEGMGPGMMGGGMMGRGPMMGSGAGAAGCPGMAATGTAPATITEEKAKELAQEYADKNLKGFTVEKVLPFATPRGTGYSVELKGPNDEVRTFHVNPWGNVMPFGGPGRRGA